ncbi:hypothetical protein [Bacillus suaedaesalsae]|uniref:Replication protein n=1 Tax=Bacillus suaedaesalsae TaxID=2810349 RepID=A0ABS2DEW0_9BACI|nr:hypothetical protein [Bacillus suaedaesalsae]MBM6616979.1 hypothetical protein [Bacillus suaedaesalsae]
MENRRKVRTDFWWNSFVTDEMTPEERYFFLYLLTNPHSIQTGIYNITKEQIALGTRFTPEIVDKLMKRFIEELQLIRYNEETTELTITDWSEYIFNEDDHE